MKKSFLLISVTLLVNISVIAQNTNKFALSVKDGSTWIKFNRNEKVTVQNFFNKYAESFGLGIDDKMKSFKRETDMLDMTHYAYQQYYKDVPVRGAVYLIHTKNGNMISGNGKIVKNINMNTSPEITSEQAIQQAIKFTGAKTYMWQSPGAEQRLKETKNNSEATYYPKAELMIAAHNPSDKATAYRLVYRVDIYASNPVSRNYVFIDAATGELFFKENRIKNTDVQGIAKTKYVGEKKIITDSLAPAIYRLRQSITGGGVETYDMNKKTDYGLANDFFDSDNYWDNVNTDQDEAATDAHYAATMTYDYFFYKYGRLSYDNQNSKLVSYVHFDNNLVNAYWDGDAMSYGDGDGVSYSALTSIDVCAHEITHAVTDNSAGLIYQGESGALSEGFSDIFGTAVEFYADTAGADWTIGEDFDLTGSSGFRSLENPKEDNLPDTYFGEYWANVPPTVDNGGVHTNCGVLAHWFYILSEGKKGTNDINNAYDVKGIGVNDAAAIAYRTLTEYLFSSAGYYDARMASLQAAEDLFGKCSDEVIAVSQAWWAVGVGFQKADDDFSLLSINYPVTTCGLTGSEHIQASAIYNGCNKTIMAGDTLNIFYQLDNGAIINDTIFLSEDIFGGDTIDFIYTTPVDLTTLGKHTINCWIKYKNDPQSGNDSLSGYTFESKLQQNFDIGITRIISPVSACHLSDNEKVKAEITFFGCDSLKKGTDIDIAYRYDSGTIIRETFKTSRTVFPLDTILYQFNTSADFNTPSLYKLDVWTEYKPDILNSNDSLLAFNIINPQTASSFDFEQDNLSLYANVEKARYANAFRSKASKKTGTYGFQMTGGNIMDYFEMLEFPAGTNEWDVNEFLSAKINFCVDATTWKTANMRFDLKQTHGGNLYKNYLGDGDYTVASNLRLLVNGVQIGGTYRPTTPKGDPFVTHYINLDTYAGTKFTLTIETRNLSKDTTIFAPYVLDNAYIDNVGFRELSYEGMNENERLNLLDVYPNPCIGEFSIKYDTDMKENLTIEVTDVLGKTIYNGEWSVNMGSNNKVISLDGYPSGVFIINIASKFGNVSRKLIKQ